MRIQGALIKLIVGFLLSSVLGQALAEEPESTLLLLSHPRSLSTAFLRYMKNRQDFATVNEPITFWKYQYPEKSDDEQAIAEVFLQSFFVENTKQVFLKEMAYQIPLRSTFISLLPAKTRVLFLIREPSQSVMSYFKEYLKDGVEMDFTKPEFTMNYEILQNVIEFFSKSTNFTYRILDAQALTDDPMYTISSICHWANMTFREKHLSWKPDPNFYPGEENWFKTVRESRGFLLPKRRHQLTDFPTNLRERIRLLIDKNTPYYQKLLKQAG